jgi:hypothetical protein
MTTATKPLSYQLATVLLALSTLLAIWNWFVQPQRAWAWATTLVLLAVMTVVALAARRSTSGTAWHRAADSVTAGIVFAGLMLASSLGLKLATALGAMSRSDLSQRMLMVILGAFFTFTGNALPKTLTPLAAKCDGARVQAFQRFAGWTWVLTGLTFATSWLVLPIDLAQPVSVVLLFGGMLIIVTQLIRVRRTRQREA